MKRVVSLAASIFLSVMLITAVNAEQKGDPTVQREVTSARTPGDTAQGIKPKAGKSWQEWVAKQREMATRVSERGNALRRAALMEQETEMTEDITISSYNAAIKTNAQLMQQEQDLDAGKAPPEQVVK